VLESAYGFRINAFKYGNNLCHFTFLC
jgi:hypothetical protein